MLEEHQKKVAKSLIDLYEKERKTLDELATGLSVLSAARDYYQEGRVLKNMYEAVLNRRIAARNAIDHLKEMM